MIEVTTVNMLKTTITTKLKSKKIVWLKNFENAMSDSLFCLIDV
jgi:hypothetical protein